MSDYKLLFHLEKTQFKNRFKELLTQPKRLIMYLLYIAFMGWIVGFNIFNSKESTIGESPNFKLYVGAGALVLFAFTATSMIKKSSLHFKLSDINYLFTAPVDNRKILMIALLKRIPTYLLTTVYTLIFLFSIVFRSIAPSAAEVFVTIVGYSFIFLIMETFSFLLFVIQAKWHMENLRSRVRKIFSLVVFIPALFFIFKSIQENGATINSLLLGLNEKSLDFIPIIGWGRFLLMSVLNGLTSMSVVALIIMTLLYVTLIILTYRFADDYYEDVIEQSEKMAELMANAKAGRTLRTSWQLKKKVKVVDKAVYGQAFNWKRKVLLLKSDFSLYFSIETLLCLVITGGLFIFGSDEKRYMPYVVSGMYFYIKFLFFMQSHLDEELKKPYFYLIPDAPMKKIIATVKIDLIRFFINIVLIVVLSSALSQTFESAYIILPFAATSVYSIMLFSNYMFNIFIPPKDFERLSVLFKMIQMIVLLLPSIIVSIVIGVIMKNILITLLGMLVVNGIISLIVLMLADVLFEKLELTK
ncbi:MAG: hypothetical protein JXR88_05100 [Clostridia bacterium]|nr:hypothetical protein [Clostridia bacterium]